MSTFRAGRLLVLSTVIAALLPAVPAIRRVRYIHHDHGLQARTVQGRRGVR